MDKDLWVIEDIEKLLILEKDGSYTINVNGGEITVGENHDKKRQEFIKTND
jgi:hypothetical protein